MERDKIISLFDDVQRSVATHRNLLTKLGRMVETQPEILRFILSNIMPHVLVISKKEPAAERVLGFFCKFSSSVGHQLLGQIIECMLLASAATDKTVRVRSCQVIAGIFKELSEGDGEISVEVADAVELCLMKRLRDKIPLVRTWAIRALSILQDPQSSNDKIMMEIIRMMNSDSSKDVRIAAVEKVNVCKLSLPDLMERVRDISPEVRVATYQRLADVVDIRHLRIPMRASVVQHGLKDRDESVRVAATKLVVKWVHCMDNDISKVINLMGLQNNEEEAELLARTIVSYIEKNRDANAQLFRELRENNMNWQQVQGSSVTPGELLWTLIRLDHYSNEIISGSGMSRIMMEDVINHLRPDTARVCELLAELYGEATSNTAEKAVLQQLNLKYLLRIATLSLDKSDVAGCSQLKKMCEAFMLDAHSVSSLMLEPVFSAWAKSLVGTTNSESGSNIKGSAEVINEATVLLVSKLWNAEKDPATEDDDEFEKLRAIELSIMALQMSLSLCGNLTNHPSGLVAVTLPFSLEALQTPSENLRMAAVRCLGLLALSSESTAPTVWEILLEVASQMQESDVTRCWAIQGLSDIASARHSGGFSQDNRLAGLLTRGMERSDLSPIVSRISAEATAKLLFSGQLKNSKMLSCLLRVYFFAEDALEEDKESCMEPGATQLGCHARVQQVLGVFFHAFCRAAHGREQLLLDCIPDFVSDYAQMCGERSDLVPLQQVLSFLISLGDDLVDDTNSAKERFLQGVCSTALASIFRECLKLDQSQSDRLVIKELVKAVQDLVSGSWADEDNARYCIGNVAYLILKSYTLDRASRKILKDAAKYYKQNVGGVMPSSDSYQSYRTEFYNLAPGLFELFDSLASKIDTNKFSEDEEEPTQRATGPARASKSKMATRRDSSSEDEEGERSSQESDGEEGIVQKRPGFHDASVKAPSREKISRSSKLVAQTKIAKMADENVENERQVEA